MDRTVYEISKKLDGTPGVSALPTRVFNGSTITLNLNFTDASPNSDIVKTKIFFEDRIYEYEFTYPSTLTLYRERELSNNAEKYHTQIKLYFSNFQTYEYIIPMWFVKSSLLEDFDGANIINAQFIDSAANGDMLIVMKNNLGQIYNFKMGTKSAFDSIYKNYTDPDIKIIAANNKTNTPSISNIYTSDDEFLIIKNK
jgi:hypothetical protein